MSGHLEGEQPQLGDLPVLTMVTNHLQILGWSSKKDHYFPACRLECDKES